eukprot:gene4755-5212_t
MDHTNSNPDYEQQALQNEDLQRVLKQLARWNLEEFMGEISYNIFSEKFLYIRKLQGIHHWTIAKLKDWISSLSFLYPHHKQVRDIIEQECIDGDVFMNLAHDEELGTTLRLDCVRSMLLSLIVTSWQQCSDDYVLPSSIPVNLIGVICGFVTDLRALPSHQIEAILQADRVCVSSGIGHIYGELVIIGHAEYRWIDERWQSFGLPNLKFPLLRRKIANGHNLCSSIGDSKSAYRIKITVPIESGPLLSDYSPTSEIRLSNETYCFCYENDPTKDVFQIGRAAYSSNDWVLPGEIHCGSDGLSSGPVSRRACRIVCSRLPPFHVHIFAGGFSEGGELLAKGAMYPGGSLETQEVEVDDSFDVDGFTTFGIKLYQPEVGMWQEVSVKGSVYTVRNDANSLPVTRLTHQYQNRLTHGSMIDIGGVIIMYQDPLALRDRRAIDTQAMVEEINKLHVQCPVLYTELTFTHVDSYSRAQRAVERSKLDLQCAGTMPMHVPHVDLSHLSEDQHIYIFPACGHVFGYHSSLEESRTCPLCRRIGPFVPLAWAAESSICDGIPSHVFNPCGHIASQKVAEYWSRISIYNRHLPFHRLCSICPFCGTELNSSRPFSKLIIQTSGVHWQDWLELKQAAHPHCIDRSHLDINSTAYLNEIVTSQQVLFHQKHRNSSIVKQQLKQKHCEHDLKGNNQVEDDFSSEDHRCRFLHFPVYATQICAFTHPFA